MKNESCEVVDILLTLINGKTPEEVFSENSVDKNSSEFFKLIADKIKKIDENPVAKKCTAITSDKEISESEHDLLLRREKLTLMLFDNLEKQEETKVIATKQKPKSCKKDIKAKRIVAKTDNGIRKIIYNNIPFREHEYKALFFDDKQNMYCNEDGSAVEFSDIVRVYALYQKNKFIDMGSKKEIPYKIAIELYKNGKLQCSKFRDKNGIIIENTPRHRTWWVDWVLELAKSNPEMFPQYKNLSREQLLKIKFEDTCLT